MTAQQFFEADSPDSTSHGNSVQFTLITAPSTLTSILSALIQAKVSKNNALPPAPFEDMTVFHALEPPAISVANYVARVSKYVFCSEACLVAAYHYINKAIERDPKLALTSLSVHRMFITAVVLACKYFDDVSYNLMYYSKVGGLPYKELANLEISMLRILDFRLDIPAKEFAEIESRMMASLLMLRETASDGTTAELVNSAVREVEQSEIVPIEFEFLTDEEEEAQMDFTDRKAPVHRKPRASPATSSVTDEGSEDSRSSSMTSTPEESYEAPVIESCANVFRKQNTFSNTLTTSGLKTNSGRGRVNPSVY